MLLGSISSKLYYVSVFSVLVPLTIFIINWKSRNSLIRLLGLLVITSALGDFVPFISARIVPISGNLYNLFQFLLLGLIFRRLFDNQAIYKVINILMVGYILLCVIQFLTVGIAVRIESLRYSSAFIFITLSLCFYFKMIKDLEVENLLKYPAFWFNTAILIYFSGNLFIYIFSEMLPQTHRFYMPINAVFNSTKNLFFAYAFWLNYKSERVGFKLSVR